MNIVINAGAPAQKLIDAVRSTMHIPRLVAALEQSVVALTKDIYIYIYMHTYIHTYIERVRERERERERERDRYTHTHILIIMIMMMIVVILVIIYNVPGAIRRRPDQGLRGEGGIQGR